MAYFEALYIDMDRSGADRVVIIEPAVPDFNTAYFALKAYRFGQYPGVVIQHPDQQSLDTFHKKVEEFSKSITVDDADGFLGELLELAQNTSGLVIMWTRWMKDTVTAARVPLPTVDVTPVGMNPKNKGIWTFVIRNYRDKIRSYSDPRQQWAAAIIIYKRVCFKNGLKPFVHMPSTKRPEDEVAAERDKLVAKIKDGYEKADTLIETIFNNLTSYGWTGSMGDTWKYHSIEKTSRFSALLYKDFVLTTNKTYADALEYLVRYEAFRRISKTAAELRIDSVTSIIFEKHPTKTKQNYLYAVVKFSIDNRLAALLFGVSEREPLDKLMKLMKTWAKDTFIK